MNKLLDDLHQEFSDFQRLIQIKFTYFTEQLKAILSAPAGPVEPAVLKPVPAEIDVAKTVATAPIWQKTQRGDLVVHANGNIDICKLSKQQRGVALAMDAATDGVLDYTVAVELVRPKSDRKKRIPLETLERRLRTVLSKINRKIKDCCAGAPLFYYN